jgi:hypothetical protein
MLLLLLNYRAEAVKNKLDVAKTVGVWNGSILLYFIVIHSSKSRNRVNPSNCNDCRVEPDESNRTVVLLDYANCRVPGKEVGIVGCKHTI